MQFLENISLCYKIHPQILACTIKLDAICSTFQSIETCYKGRLPFAFLYIFLIKPTVNLFLGVLMSFA